MQKLIQADGGKGEYTESTPPMLGIWNTLLKVWRVFGVVYMWWLPSAHGHMVHMARMCAHTWAHRQRAALMRAGRDSGAPYTSHVPQSRTAASKQAQFSSASLRLFRTAFPYGFPVRLSRRRMQSAEVGPKQLHARLQPRCPALAPCK